MISGELRCLRQSLGLTQQRMAFDIGMDRSKYCRAEAGLAKLTEPELARLGTVIESVIKQRTPVWLRLVQATQEVK
jgi:transcriptional regulator with XRE-family HTH domain